MKKNSMVHGSKTYWTGELRTALNQSKHTSLLLRCKPFCWMLFCCMFFFLSCLFPVYFSSQCFFTICLFFFFAVCFSAECLYICCMLFAECFFSGCFSADCQFCSSSNNRAYLLTLMCQINVHARLFPVKFVS